MRGLLAAVLLAIIALLPSSSSALDPAKPLTQCRLDVWGARDGLPPFEITCIAQTADGYLWLGTDAGLVRFDGSRFVIYTRWNTPGLTSNLITALLTGRDGTLWVGTEWGGYGRFADGKFLPCGRRYTVWNKTSALTEARDGSIWASEWDGLAHLRLVQGSVASGQIKPGVVFLGAAELPKRDMLCAVMGQPLLEVGGTGKSAPFPTIPALFNYDYSCLTRTDDGSYWIGTSHHGLYRIQNHRLRQYTRRDGLSSDTVNCLYQDRQGVLWIGTKNGVDGFRAGRLSAFGTTDGLVGGNVRAVCEDQEGNLWAGAGYGLHRFANTRFTPYVLKAGLETVAITTLQQTGSGTLLCGTDRGIWALSAPRDAPVTVRRWLNDRNILNVGRFADGSLIGRYVGLKGEGIPFYLRGSRFNTWHRDSFPDIFLPQGQDLLGFTYSAYFLFQGATIKKSGAQKSQDICSARRDAKGTVWIGSMNGLVEFKNGKSVLHTAGLPPGAHVLCVDTSDPQQIWLGTDRGIGRFDGSKITLYGLKEGLPDDNIFNLVRDHHGVLWAGGHFGIFSVRVQDLDACDQRRLETIPTQSYNAADGIRTYPTLYGNCECTPDGRIWFAGSGGLTLLDPDAVSRNPLPPPVHIEEAMLDQTALDLRHKTIVTAGPGKLTIHYAALSFTAPEKVRFKYRLLGFDPVWVNAETGHTATYTNLPPGAYHFQVVACNNDGLWNQAGDGMDFVLKPHFYQTLWFRVLVGIGLLLLFFSISALRLTALRAQNRRLEQSIAERTEQLAEAHEELLAQNSQLQNNQAALEAQNEEMQQVKEDLKVKNIVLEAANSRLADLATIDGLTGLKNHRSFQERLEQEWVEAVRYGIPLSVLLMDVDQFKAYNDTHGHPAGDEVLRQVGRILQDCARDSDFVARYGGEEFVVVLPHTDLAGAATLAERYRSVIEAAAWPHRSVTASFGIASATLATPGPSTLIAEADAALYRSKEAGRNRVTALAVAAP